MSQTVDDPALASLTLWWRDMGIVADEAHIRAHGTARTVASETQAPPRKAPPARMSRKARQRTPAEWSQVAGATAAACKTHGELVDAITAFDGCPLKEAATKTVVFDGVQGAPVMVIGEGPGRDEDLAGLPFVGRAGKLLDKMLASIDIDRTRNALITNVNYWRPPRNRNPEADELQVCAPFVHRMIALNRPKLIIAAGAVPAKALLGSSSGIMKLRGTQQSLEVTGAGTIPLMPILHPAYLLRRPEEKARAWRDLLTIENLLQSLT
ncbi:MAG: uracil-DNA glycosylase [Pseudomonadota bacterium]